MRPTPESEEIIKPRTCGGATYSRFRAELAIELYLIVATQSEAMATTARDKYSRRL